MIARIPRRTQSTLLLLTGLVLAAMLLDAWQAAAPRKPAWNVADLWANLLCPALGGVCILLQRLLPGRPVPAGRGRALGRRPRSPRPHRETAR